MTIPRLPAPFLRLAVALSIFAGLVLASPLSLLSANRVAAAPLYTVPGYSVLVPSGGTAFLLVRGIALAPGSTLPTGPLTLSSQPLAPDRMRTALFYGLDWGYGETDVQQVALAVWWMQDGVWREANHAIAEHIGTAAASASGIPSWNPDGRSILGMVSQGGITLSDLSLTPDVVSPSVGSGTLAVHNTGSQDALVYLPYGTVFGTSSQVIVWSAGIGNGGQAQPTATQADEASATPTAAPTDTPQPILPTATPVAASKGGPPVPPGVQSSPTATIAPKPPPATSTPIAPVATNTPVEIATSAPADTATPVPSDTPVPTATQVPPTPEVETQASTGPEVVRNSASIDQGNEQSPNSGPAAPNPVIPPAQEPSATATSTATATSVSADLSSNAPAPIGTSGASNLSAPAPVTTQSSAAVPVAQSTGAVPLAQSTVPVPVSTELATISVPTDVPTPLTGLTSVAPTTSLEPSPAPLAPTDTPASNTEPVIDTAPDTTKETIPPPPPVDQSNNSAANGNGPNDTPSTGAGPSSLPNFLAASALLMILAGWYLRRASRATQKVESGK